MTDLVLTFAAYAVPIVGCVVVLFVFVFLAVSAIRWNREDPRPGYIYDREKERLPW